MTTFENGNSAMLNNFSVDYFQFERKNHVQEEAWEIRETTV